MKKSKKIYLDYASGAPTEGRVLSVMQTVARKYFANPSAIHALGVESLQVLNTARETIAKVFGAHSNEIIFTSGATESNNLVIQNFKNIVTTNIEHASILEPSRLRTVTYVPVETNGIVDPKKIKKALTPKTTLVSVMYANNEIGTIQPIREIAKEIRHYNKLHNTKILFHTDATQAINYLSIGVEKLGIDLLSFNGAKIYGPKGVGGLFVKRHTPIHPILFGGDQETTLRPGTENLPAIVGLAKALEITTVMKEKEVKRLTKLRDYTISKLVKLSGVVLNGDSIERLPNNINISISQIPSDLLVIELSAYGIMVSAKSACKSGEAGGSHVILAINPTASTLDGSIRFSLGRATTKTDIDYMLQSLKAILTKLKRWYT